MAGTWIQTFARVAFEPLKPRVADVRLEDMAHALSNVCRWKGHVLRFYSVAEHSVRVSLLAEEYAKAHPRVGQNAEYVRMVARWGLIHDGSEAYLGDPSRPVKSHPAMRPFLKIEAKLQATIAKACGLPERQPAEVTRADNVLLATEAREILRGGPLNGWTDGMETLEGVQGFGWDPIFAEGKFMERFRSLTEEIKP